MKRNPDRLRVVALVIVAMSVVSNFWLIAPAFSPGRFRVHWMDLAALGAIGGLCGASYLRQLQARPILPVHAALAEEELHHEPSGRAL